MGGLCGSAEGGVYIDCGVSNTFHLSSIGDSEGGGGAIGCSGSSERMENDTNGHQGGY